MKGKRVSFSEVENSLLARQYPRTPINPRRVSLQEQSTMKNYENINVKLEKYRNLLAKVMTFFESRNFRKVVFVHE